MPSSIKPIRTIHEYIRITFVASDVTIPLHMQEVWGLNSTKVGLVFIAAIVPTTICKYPLIISQTS